MPTKPITAAYALARTGLAADIAQNVPMATGQAAQRLLTVAAGREELDPFFARVMNALARIAETQDPPKLTATDSTFDALILMLSEPEILAEGQSRDPLAPARLRGLALQRQLLTDAGGTVSARELGAALGISRQAVDKRRKRGALIGLHLGRRGYAYPAWQVGLDGLAEVLAEMRDLSPWTQAAFMLAPNRWLAGESPLHTLQAGNCAGVLAAARMYGEQIAA